MRSPFCDVVLAGGRVAGAVVQMGSGAPRLAELRNPTIDLRPARAGLVVGRPLADTDLLLSEPMARRCPCANTAAFAQRKAARLKAITVGELRHSNISRMRAAGISADVLTAWHGHTERMTMAVYGPVTDDRLTAAPAVFSAAVGQSWDK